jgi:hypothetical protein
LHSLSGRVLQWIDGVEVFLAERAFDPIEAGIFVGYITLLNQTFRLL